MRGIALKAAGAALHAELRAAANTERRTANAAMRDMDCIMTTTSYCVAEQVSNGLGVVVGGNDEGHKWSKRHAGCSALESTRESGHCGHQASHDYCTNITTNQYKMMLELGPPFDLT